MDGALTSTSGALLRMLVGRQGAKISDIGGLQRMGTLEHPRYTDKQGATINAFQHFTYINSNKSLVLADIQSSESHAASQKSSILFDLMSHTMTGDSGAGDHGDKGIQTFVDQHQCGQRCNQLGLQSFNLKNAEEDV
ncbi:kinase-like domain-containing protein [Mycena rebaudengoi]|nr:kinase-like domain-containing protein [Mycena rebaudengoi]